MPSRTDVPEYAEYLERIEALVAVVNHRHGTPDWMPIHLKLRDDLEEAVASYKHYDVLLVNAMFDGMNLVAKEGPLVNERDGVSILSENTGAHEELGEFALSVNPFDIQELADSIHAALTMAPRRARAGALDGLKEIVTARDPGDWIDEQLDDIRAQGGRRPRRRRRAGRQGQPELALAAAVGGRPRPRAARRRGRGGRRRRRRGRRAAPARAPRRRRRGAGARRAPRARRCRARTRRGGAGARRPRARRRRAGRERPPAGAEAPAGGAWRRRDRRQPRRAPARPTATSDDAAGTRPTRAASARATLPSGSGGTARREVHRGCLGGRRGRVRPPATVPRRRPWPAHHGCTRTPYDLILLLDPSADDASARRSSRTSSA